MFLTISSTTADLAEKTFALLVFCSSADLCNLKNELSFISSFQFLSSFCFVFLLSLFFNLHSPVRSRDSALPIQSF